jgi:hypothetical protein
MTPKKVAVAYSLREYRVRMARSKNTYSNRTMPTVTVHIECPHIVDGLLPAKLTTKDEELGTDHVCGMVKRTAWPGKIAHDVGPLSCF